MTELLIPASAIKAAARAMWEDYQDKTTASEQVSHEEEAEAALRAAFDELEMVDEWKPIRPGRVREYRLISRWMPCDEIAGSPSSSEMPVEES